MSRITTGVLWVTLISTPLFASSLNIGTNCLQTGINFEQSTPHESMLDGNGLDNVHVVDFRSPIRENDDGWEHSRSTSASSGNQGSDDDHRIVFKQGGGDNESGGGSGNVAAGDPVPEPSSWVLMLSGAALLSLRILPRRRRQSA